MDGQLRVSLDFTRNSCNHSVEHEAAREGCEAHER
jgi:hypothetical protein